MRTAPRIMAGWVAVLVLPGIAPAAERPATRPAGRRPPNIVLIVADDLGYADIGVQGCKDVPTPHIDSLARNGVRFTSGYVSCPVCSPTRAGLMTGRYQQRFGHEFNPGGAGRANQPIGLKRSETTLAERLKPLGYATGMFGKWHLGNQPELRPQRRGFDEFFGFLGGAHSYVETLENSNNPILRGDEPVKTIDYATDAFAREAVAFIRKHRDEPFFVYLPFNSVHLPLQAPERYLSRFSAIEDQKRRTLAAMLSAMDDGVGSVLAALRETEVEDNTLIFFISDNGGPTPRNTSRNTPLRGYKGQVLEGGVRVPFLIQWKGRLPAGRVYDHPVIALDIHPTALAAAGGSPPPDARLDGVDLLPYLGGDRPGPPHEHLFWRFGQQWAVRSGDWKLVAQQAGEKQLYQLARDAGESTNLAGQEPDRVKALQAAYDQWNAQLAEPAWGPSRPRAAAARRQQRRAAATRPG